MSCQAGPESPWERRRRTPSPLQTIHISDCTTRARARALGLRGTLKDVCGFFGFRVDGARSGERSQDGKMRGNPTERTRARGEGGIHPSLYRGILGAYGERRHALVSKRTLAEAVARLASWFCWNSFRRPSGLLEYTELSGSDRRRGLCADRRPPRCGRPRRSSSYKRGKRCAYPSSNTSLNRSATSWMWNGFCIRRLSGTRTPWYMMTSSG